LTTRCEKRGLLYCVLGGMFFLAAALLYPAAAAAKAVSFTIDNKLERTQEYNVGGWIYSDIISQIYELKWEHVFSTKLKAGTIFKLTMDDTLKSQDIDTKVVTPSAEITLNGNVWDLAFTFKDTVTFSNEFNTPRHDTIDAGADFNLIPYLLPPLKASYKVNRDYQKDLVDTQERKLDLSTTFTFDLFTIDGSWRQGTKDDFLRVNADTEDAGWDFNLSYNQVLTPALRLAYTNALVGDRLETFDHDTGILATPPALVHTINNKIKLELQGYPVISSYIELGRERSVPTDDTKDTVGFDVTATQDVLSIGTAKESATYTLTSEDSPTIDTAEGKWLYTLELAGSPYRYVDYTIKYTLEDVDKDATLPADDLVSRDGKLDLSATITPTTPITLDVGYSQAAKDVNGSRASESSTFKVKGAFRGEFLDIPNLTFTPTANINRERNYGEDTFTRSEDIKLEFKYSFNLPDPLVFDLAPTYGWMKTAGKTTDNYYSLSYTMGAKGRVGGWGANITLTGEFKNNLGPVDGAGVWSLAKDLEIAISRKLTRTLTSRYSHKYKVPADSAAGTSDADELGLQWSYMRMNAELTMNRDRTFADPRIDTRKIVARFGMLF
jgi:hypothetical protein